MTDLFSPAERSAIMRQVKSEGGKPEWLVRRTLHALGYRYRLHGKELPGKPDLVFASRRAAIFVHGCFWHGHDCARGAREPKTNTAYWRAKIARNRARDEANAAALAASGWRVLILWECELKEPGWPARAAAFLDAPADYAQN